VTSALIISFLDRLYARGMDKILLISSTRSMIGASAPAREALNASRGVCLDTDDRLFVCDRGTDEHFGGLLAQLEAQHPLGKQPAHAAPCAHHFPFPVDGERAPNCLEIRIIDDALPSPSAANNGQGHQPTPRFAIGLKYRQDQEHCLVDENVLRELHGLTPAEANVAAWVVNGQSLAEHAAAKKVSKNTSRFHLYNAMQKAGCSTQVELVRTSLLLGTFSR